ncbi:MAG: hypothetical protein MUC88_27275 [Planctomycetes bacterium]|jgi:RHS repeat-associated protein|nr:hypothetical protein [Planctomycetota bacterium]
MKNWRSQAHVTWECQCHVVIVPKYPNQQTDAAGNRTRLTYPDANYVSYEYDQLNRLTVVRDDANTPLAAYAYDSRSRRTALAYANGAYATYDYDVASRLLCLDNQTNNGQHKYSYGYDYVGNRMNMLVTDSSGTRSHVYAYDRTYQITEVNYPADLDYLATDTEFNYDPAGNRTSVIDGSGTTNYTANNLNQYTAAGGTSFSYDSSGNMTHDDNFAYGYDPENRLVEVKKSGSLPPLTLAEAVELPLTFTTGGDANWSGIYAGACQGGDCAESGNLAEDQESWLEASIEGPGTLKFWWKAPGESGNTLEFRLDSQLSASINNEDDWQEVTRTIAGAGPHTLRWTYSRGAEDGRGYVDYLQWTGTMPFVPEPDPNDWKVLTYTYDASGRRIAKTYDGDVILKYVYDADHCIAEYDAAGNLHRKYVYGPGVDQPISMTETAGSYGGTYYYHFDALGSVVALTDADANTVEVCEYDVYGRVGATDANHPNRFLFTGRELDKETGLYYYRARYYNPQIGRFLQTDPVGYSAGMNWYVYCGNNSTNGVDPSGLKWEDSSVRIIFYDSDERADSWAASDPFWDVRIDISGRAAQKAGYRNSAEYIKAICDGNALKDIIMAQMPDCEWRTSGKIYDRDATTIEGVWILGHGSTFGDDPRTGQSNSLLWSSTEYADMFAGLGQALNRNDGGGAPIHLRSCSLDGQQALHKARAAAIASGHEVTVALGDLVVDNGLNPLIWGDAPWYCTNGFAKVTPTVNADGSVSTSSRFYRGYEATVNRAGQGACISPDLPVSQNSIRLY